jgi:hypothetical protein
MKLSLSIALGFFFGFMAPASAVTCTLGTDPSNPDTAYQIHSDQTVTDLRTGLMWKRCAEGQGWGGAACTGAATPYTWSAALTHAEAHSFATHNDWRLPNIKELQTLVETCRATGLISDFAFPGAPTDEGLLSVFWSGSPDRTNMSNAWAVYFYTGSSVNGARGIEAAVRLVRGGQSFAAWGATPNGPTVTGTAPTAPGFANTVTAMTFTVTFSETVNGVTSDDFRLRAGTGSVTASFGATPSCTSGLPPCNSWVVPVNIQGGNGTLFLDVKSWGTGIKNAANTAELNRSYTSGTGHAVYVAIPGACGTADGQNSATAPTTNLCTTGGPSPVTKLGGAGEWNWMCNGLAGSAVDDSCLAPAPPNSPTAVTPTPYNAGATVSWTAPAEDGGSPITGYTVFRQPNGDVACTSLAPATACTVTGLANGTSYTFAVWATNAIGNSALSVASASITPSADLATPPPGGGTGSTAPNPPTHVTPTAYNASATVSWTAPVVTGGSPITGYIVYRHPDGSIACTTVAPTTACTVNGLTNNTLYTFNARATNAIGNSALSAMSIGITPLGTLGPAPPGGGGGGGGGGGLGCGCGSL